MYKPLTQTQLDYLIPDLQDCADSNSEMIVEVNNYSSGYKLRRIKYSNIILEIRRYSHTNNLVAEIQNDSGDLIREWTFRSDESQQLLYAGCAKLSPRIVPALYLAVKTGILSMIATGRYVA